MLRKWGNGVPESSNYAARGMAIGLAIGAGWGVALDAGLKNMAFMSIGVGAGMCIGPAIGAGLDKKAKGARDAASVTDATDSVEEWEERQL